MRRPGNQATWIVLSCVGPACGSTDRIAISPESGGLDDAASSGGSLDANSDASASSDAEDASNGAGLWDGPDFDVQDGGLVDAEYAYAMDSGDGTATLEGPASFHCVNWADPRDNFVNGLLQPSGLSSTSDTYPSVRATAGAILSAFQANLQANSIRIPINEPTVLGSWWNAYRGIIDASSSKGMKVVVAYWAYHLGRPDSITAFDSMWQVVVSAYASNPLVYFDIVNEPYGYTGAQWIDFAAQWLAGFPSVPRNRVIVAGTGYDDHVTQEGADPRLDGCLLSLHIYPFYTPLATEQGWRSDMMARLGSFYPRTIVSEWGAPMMTGLDYNKAIGGNVNIAFMTGVPNQMRDYGMGSCFWPGLRTGDAWSIHTLSGTGANLSLSITNASGRDRIRWAWGI